MALNYNVTLQNDTIIMYVVFHLDYSASVLIPYIRVWTSSQSAAAVAAKGLRFVHSPSDYFYLVTLNLFFESPPYLMTLDILRIAVRANGLAIRP